MVKVDTYYTWLRGRSNPVRVNVCDGLTLVQAAEKLQSAGAEGVLTPSTAHGHVVIIVTSKKVWDLDRLLG